MLQYLASKITSSTPEGGQEKETKASVLSVNTSSEYTFTKPPVPKITLIENLGVEGDVHSGTTVKHRSRLHQKPLPPNLRQVHLIHSEILAEVSASVAAEGNGDIKEIKPGELGENITTTGIDLLTLGKGTKLRFVDDENESGDGADVATVVVTGVRNPCPQIDKFQKGLKEKFLVRDANRAIVGRKAGIMSTVEVGGEVRPGMRIVVEKPAVHEPLGPV